MLSSLKVGRVIPNAPFGLSSPFIAAILSLALSVAAHALEVRLTDAKAQPISDAVVSLVPLGAPAKITPPAEPIVVTQSGEEFSPYVTPVVAGTRVVFRNDDKVKHHVYSATQPTKFDLPLSGGETKNSVLFDRPGVIPIGCNIHEWMSAYVVVLNTPYFASSSAAGLAALPAVPAGRYRLEIWHPRLAKTDTRELTLTATGDAPLVVTLTLKPDRRIRRAPAGMSGGSYK